MSNSLAMPVPRSGGRVLPGARDDASGLGRSLSSASVPSSFLEPRDATLRRTSDREGGFGLFGLPGDESAEGRRS
jgi:hypothetical protein